MYISIFSNINVKKTIVKSKIKKNKYCCKMK